MKTNQHQRTRHDHATETAEDYVEAVFELASTDGACRVTDLAAHFAVSHVTVTKIIRRLQREKLVEKEPYGPIYLTNRGRSLARASRKRHRIVYEFLKALGVGEANAAIDTEGIEHHVSKETLNAMRKFTEDRTA